MKWWITAWQLCKDILLTGTGIGLIIMQGLSRQPPNTDLLWTGLALTVPAATSKVIALWSAPSEDEHGPPESSPPARSHGAAGSPSSSPEVSGD